MRTYDDLKKQVEQRDGLLRVRMETLRDIHGAGKLGVHVRKAISGQLAAHGLGHLPADLPSYQEDEVRVYRLGTAIADTINAVLHPTPTGDRVLLSNVGTSAQEVLKRIRELVCE